MSTRYSVPLIITITAWCLVSGCSDETLRPPKTVPVSGSVTYQGKPTRGVRVKFHPQFDIGDVPFTPYGETGADGKFLLNTGASGNGAPKGDYIVTMEMPYIDADPKDGLEAELDYLRGAYSDPAKSNLKVTIKDGNNVLEPFQLN